MQIFTIYRTETRKKHAALRLLDTSCTLPILGRRAHFPRYLKETSWRSHHEELQPY